MAIIKKCLYCNKEFETLPSYIKKGGGKYCSRSCVRTHKNILNNPVNIPGVKEKISKNHKDVSGKNNPMYGKRDKESPNYIDGRSKINGRIGRRVAFTNLLNQCYICGETDIKKLDAHHLDRNRKNNNISNLKIVCKTCHMTKVHKNIKNDKGQFTNNLKTNNILFE